MNHLTRYAGTGNGLTATGGADTDRLVPRLAPVGGRGHACGNQHNVLPTAYRNRSTERGMAA